MFPLLFKVYSVPSRAHISKWCLSYPAWSLFKSVTFIVSVGYLNLLLLISRYIMHDYDDHFINSNEEHLCDFILHCNATLCVVPVWFDG